MQQCIAAPNDCDCQIDDILFAETINRFLGSLSREKRNIFLRRYWFTDSISDISKRFGYSESKVKTTLFRIRAQLREYLEKEGITL